MISLLSVCPFTSTIPTVWVTLMTITGLVHQSSLKCMHLVFVWCFLSRHHYNFRLIKRMQLYLSTSRCSFHINYPTYGLLSICVCLVWVVLSNSEHELCNTIMRICSTQRSMLFMLTNTFVMIVTILVCYGVCCSVLI